MPRARSLPHRATPCVCARVCACTTQDNHPPLPLPPKARYQLPSRGELISGEVEGERKKEKRRFVRGSANLEREAGPMSIRITTVPMASLKLPAQSLPRGGGWQDGVWVGGLTEWLTDARTRGDAEWFVFPSGWWW